MKKREERARKYFLKWFREPSISFIMYKRKGALGNTVYKILDEEGKTMAHAGGYNYDKVTTCLCEFLSAVFPEIKCFAGRGFDAMKNYLERGGYHLEVDPITSKRVKFILSRPQY